MEFGCQKCNRSFNELLLWNRLKNENYHWICTSCNVPLIRNQNERNMEYGCQKCNHTFVELKSWKWLKHCGNYWKCLSCGGDITRHPKIVHDESLKLAEMLWNVN